VIADLMLGGTGQIDGKTEEMSDISISAVQEAMNQMMGSSATSMSTIFNRFVNISPPGIDIIDLLKGEGESQLPPEEMFIKVSFRLIIGDLIDSSIMQLLPIDFAKEMVSILMGDSSAAPEQLSSAGGQQDAPQQESASAQQQAPAAPSQPSEQHSGNNTPPPAPQRSSFQPPPPQPGYSGLNRNVNVQPAQFSGFSGAPLMQGEETNLNLLLDIPLKVTVELGRTQKIIKEILELSQGSIIELDKLAGEPVDILVNNKLIAKGEVVVIDENFGVRVTDIVSDS
jgi:flagellar motor switch protein FliN/FliY